jgi:hypothetical protein
MECGRWNVGDGIMAGERYGGLNVPRDLSPQGNPKFTLAAVTLGLRMNPRVAGGAIPRWLPWPCAGRSATQGQEPNPR